MGEHSTSPQDNTLEPTPADEKTRFWIRFCQRSGLATIVAFVLPLFMRDVCGAAFAFAAVAVLIVPPITVIGLFMLAVRSSKGRGCLPVVGASVLTVVWLGWFSVLGMAAGMSVSVCL